MRTRMKMKMKMKTTYSASLSSLSDAWPGSIEAKDFRLFTTLRSICGDGICLKIEYVFSKHLGVIW